MSHLINEISGNTSDRQGDVTAPNITALTDVAFTSLTADQGVKYNGSSWVNDSASLSAYTSVVYTNGVSGLGADGYTYPPPSYMNSTHYAYARVITTNGVVIMNEIDLGTDIEATRHIANFSNSQYCQGFQIAAGVKAILSADVVCEGTNSTAYRDLRWQTIGGTALGPITRVQVQSGKNRHTIYGYIEASESVEVALKMVAGSGTIGFNMDTATRENVVVIAKKVL